MTNLLKNKDYIKNFVEAELQISSRSKDDPLLHREKGKAIFGDDLDEAIDFIHKQVAIQKKLNGSVHENTANVLAAVFEQHFRDRLTKIRRMF